MLYNLDKKQFVGDNSNYMSAPSPTSSQSSMSSTTSGSSLNSGYCYRSSDSDYQAAFTSIPTRNLNAAHFSQDSFTCQLAILEEPTEKFRFRYKSEMHGTHGSLNGERSSKTKKTFPEVELRNFIGSAVIRCSLYQTNLDKPSPHSHQLVVRKEETDQCDPHDVYVSQEKGYIARFENMGIIHTAKKNICDALYTKKKQKMMFEMGLSELSQRQERQLRDEAEREGKLMNLNQVRLCFEAFKIDEGSRVWERICNPVYSRPINNRKSALTGELKICRLSAVAGSAEGKEDLILLVEKVSKKNIQVRFYEVSEDDQVWEAFGEFSDTDVHHQYAIVVRTPPYRNKDIDSNVNVFIELVRKSDDERSAPVTFRYKPRDVVMSRKRRRTSYQSTTSSPVSSSELPVPVAVVIPQGHFQHPQLPQQQQQQQMYQQQTHQQQTISQEFDKDLQLNLLLQSVTENNSDELAKILSPDFIMYDVNGDELSVDSAAMAMRDSLPADAPRLVYDGAAKRSVQVEKKSPNQDLKLRHPKMKPLLSTVNNSKLSTKEQAEAIQKIFDDYVAENDAGDTIMHDIVKNDYLTDGMLLVRLLQRYNLIGLLSQPNNKGQTPLHVACIFDQPSFIRPLLGQKCDPNIQDSNNNTALHIAIAENLKQCLEGFINFINSNNSNLDANLANDRGFTPLHLAIRANNIELVEVLLRKGNASAKTAISSDGNNALHLAVQCKSKLMVKCLLDNSDVRVNAKNRSGHTAIDLAKAIVSETEKKEILDLLLPKLPPSEASEGDAMSIDSIKDEPDDDSSPDEDEERSEIEEKNEEVSFIELLKAENIKTLLAKLLNVDNKWIKLSAELQMSHLTCIWLNADAMLVYLYNNVSPLKLFTALQAVDPDIVCTLMQQKNL